VHPHCELFGQRTQQRKGALFSWPPGACGCVAIKPAVVTIALATAPTQRDARGCRRGSAGLKQLLMLHSSQRLSEHTSAALAVTWQPQVGLGMQFTNTRQLTESVQGDFSWVLGPPEAAGMGLGIGWSGERSSVSGKLEVMEPPSMLSGAPGSAGTAACSSCCTAHGGFIYIISMLPARPQVGAVTGISCRCMRSLSESANGRVSAKLTTIGVELEIGASRRVNESSTVGLSVVVGIAVSIFRRPPPFPTIPSRAFIRQPLELSARLASNLARARFAGARAA
jgi:hypothetical protein